MRRRYCQTTGAINPALTALEQKATLVLERHPVGFV